MSTISVSLPSDGSAATVSQYNTPITTIVNAINGGLDNANIASSAGIDGSKLANASVSSTQINFGNAGAGVWWEEIGRTTLAVAGDVLSVTGLAARTHLKIIAKLLPTGGTITASATFNSDTGANYANRVSINGAADVTTTAQTACYLDGGSAVAQPVFIEGEITNASATEKYIIAHVETAATGAGNAPTRCEWTNKWANTSNQISTFTITNGGSGDYAIGTEIIILGHN